LRIIETDNLPQMGLDLQQIVYNGLDGMMTMEVDAAIPPNPTYFFERDLLPLVLEMMHRGILIDQGKRDSMVTHLQQRLTRIANGFDTLCNGVWGKTFNPRSYLQLQDLLYNRLFLPQVIVSKKGEKKVSTDRDALEKLHREYSRAMPVTAHLLKMRDLEKTIDVLTKSLSPSGRWHANFNIGGTDTGRWSSSSHPFGWGSNLQNIDDYIRRIFIPDPGYIFFNCDQQGAEARVVGYLAGDTDYIKAVESGDVHTMVAAMVFGFEPKRELADRKYYREMSFRDIAKRAAHGCLTADHDVLTPHGWQPIDTITTGDYVACWDPSGAITFDRVRATTNFIYDGTLYHFEGTAYDLLATHDHRMPYTTDTTFKVTSAENLPESARLPTGGTYVGGTYGITPLDARRIAAMQADGSINSGNVRFHIKKTRKIQRVDKLFGKQKWARDSKGAYSCTISLSIFRPEIYKHPGSYFLNWPREALEAWLDETRHWDSHIGKTHVSFSSARKETIDWYQTVAALCGKGTTYQGTSISGFGSTIHKAHLNRRTLAHASNMRLTKIPTEGTRVHCLTVPTSYFLVRRNNKIMVTGNSNYGGSAYTIARTLKVETKLIEEFQSKYFRTFPNLRKWQIWVAQQVQTNRRLVTPFGRVRNFWDNPKDDTTIRAAIAFVPQSTVGDMTSRGLLAIRHIPEVQILNNIHDAAFGQIPLDMKDTLVPRIVEALTFPLQVTDIWGNIREMTIPWESQTGMNWGKKKKDNPDGLA
jgi:hypothetical protein